jgi:hypothetical protein
MVAAAAREGTWNIKFPRSFGAEEITELGEFCASLSQVTIALRDSTVMEGAYGPEEI